MRICRVEIQNFRGIKKARIDFSKHGVLLGANNAGKSTVVEALAILFGRERMVRQVSDWDFYQGAPKPESRFFIVATVTGFEADDPLLIPEWFVGENLARPIWWNEGTNTTSNEADRPEGFSLAAQIALAGRYDDETCDFELARYFHYGDSDPFTDGCSSVPIELIRQCGVFLLSSSREWDKLLSFSSSSLLKVIREYDAMPGQAIESLKTELRDRVTKVEEAVPFSTILQSAAKELQSFLLIHEASGIAYRPTSLDTVSVMQSLTAHIVKEDGVLVPVSRQGAGLVSLQAFLLLLAFAEQRKSAGKNFILLAEEPELHLHPSLHNLLVHRIRAASDQSIITTQSPNVAMGYQPNEVVFIQNLDGLVEAAFLRREPIASIPSNSIKKLFLNHREALYEALMGGVVLIPEGQTDFEWLRLWQSLAQVSQPNVGSYSLVPMTIVPTADAAIAKTFEEIARFRRELIPVVDGDGEGVTYLQQLAALPGGPSKIVQYGADAAIECLSAWILEPSLPNSGDALASLLPDPGTRNLRSLQNKLIERKHDAELRENLVWQSIDQVECCRRACEFFHDVSAIARGGATLNANWASETCSNGAVLFKATHVRRA
jgi:putative ATP-dependent endonuclease of the OLD family